MRALVYKHVNMTASLSTHLVYEIEKSRLRDIYNIDIKNYSQQIKWLHQELYLVTLNHFR